MRTHTVIWMLLGLTGLTAAVNNEDYTPPPDEAFDPNLPLPAGYEENCPDMPSGIPNSGFKCQGPSGDEKSDRENMAHQKEAGECRYYLDGNKRSASAERCRESCELKGQPIEDGVGNYGCRAIGTYSKWLLYDFRDYEGDYWSFGECQCNNEVISFIGDMVVEIATELGKWLEKVLNPICHMFFDVLELVVDVGVSAIPGGAAVTTAAKAARMAVMAAKATYENGGGALAFGTLSNTICEGLDLGDAAKGAFEGLIGVDDSYLDLLKGDPDLDYESFRKCRRKGNCRDAPKGDKQPPDNDRDNGLEKPNTTTKGDDPAPTPTTNDGDAPSTAPPTTNDGQPTSTTTTPDCSSKTKASDCVVTCTPIETGDSKPTTTCDTPTCSSTRDACTTGSTKTVTSTDDSCGTGKSQSACPMCTPFVIKDEIVGEDTDEENGGLPLRRDMRVVAGRNLERRAEKVISAFGGAAGQPNHCSISSPQDQVLRIPTYDSGGQIMKDDYNNVLAAKNPDKAASIVRWYTTTVDPARCTPDVVKVPANQYNGGTLMGGKRDSGNPQRPSLDHVWEKSWLREFFDSLMDNNAKDLATVVKGDPERLKCADVTNYLFGYVENNAPTKNELKPLWDSLPSKTNLDLIGITQQLNEGMKGMVVEETLMTTQHRKAFESTKDVTKTTAIPSALKDVRDRIEFLLKFDLGVRVMEQNEVKEVFARTNSRLYQQMVDLDQRMITTYPDVDAFKCQYLSFSSAFRRYIDNRIRGLQATQTTLSADAMRSLDKDMGELRKRTADIDKATQADQDLWSDLQRKYSAYRSKSTWAMSLSVTWPQVNLPAVDPSCSPPTPPPPGFKCNFIRQCLGFDCPDETPSPGCLDGVCTCM